MLNSNVKGKLATKHYSKREKGGKSDLISHLIDMIT